MVTRDCIVTINGLCFQLEQCKWYREEDEEEVLFICNRSYGP